jgi:hypothetical protein
MVPDSDLDMGYEWEFRLLQPPSQSFPCGVYLSLSPPHTSTFNVSTQLDVS